MRTEKVMSTDRAQEIQMSIFMDFGVLTPSLSPQTEIIFHRGEFGLLCCGKSSLKDCVGVLTFQS